MNCFLSDGYESTISYLFRKVCFFFGQYALTSVFSIQGLVETWRARLQGTL